jgi:hypothetical protein
MVQQKAAGKIKVLPLNPNPGLAVDELAVQIVVTYFPHPPIHPRGNRSQRPKNFKQLNIIAAVAYCNLDRVIGGRGINRQPLRLRSARKKGRA